MKQFLCSLALLAGAGVAHAAVCTEGDRDFGTVSDTSGGTPYTYAAACSALLQDPADPATWAFTHELDFTLAHAGDIFGTIDLNFTRLGGQPFFMISIDAIGLVHDGATTWIGSEGAGHYEVSRFRAIGLEAGDYTVLLNGRLFDQGARSGFYDGTLDVRYDVAAPVPEPGALGLLLLGAPLVAWGLRRRATAAA